MKIKNSINAYSGVTAEKYIFSLKPIMNVASEVETQYNWVDNKRTDEVVGYKLYFV
ncbi:hypothetical protein [Weissella cibaria]|uniref:Uncharacterized protein n=1 Tax=Weissella cibaria TaxID=137591 RepID=A0A0D1K723_9LACO|nr:hypothetical protein [Weissella cibaria]KIU20779.1 hypothetical protein QX99_01086 [Weissella cibaria]KIU23323.1 hypothetical protein ff3pr_00992 [Weissella cibaria]MDV8930198.1 hypothetical protein [Weissella cibaria]